MAEFKEPLLAPLSGALQRTVDAMRRALKSIYHVHPDVDDEAMAETAERLAQQLAEAATLPLGQESVLRNTTSPFMGTKNPIAPPVVYTYGENALTATFRFHEGYQGPPACVHGGFVAGLLDDVLGRTRLFTGRNCVTGSLNITYKRPTPLNTDLVAQARIEEIFERKFRVTGEILHNGEITASAEAIFVFRDEEKFNALISEARSASK